MGLRDELLAEVGSKTHVAELCGRAADELLIQEMKIDRQERQIELLRAALGRSAFILNRAADACADGDLSDSRIDDLSVYAAEIEGMYQMSRPK